eukprot:10210325-Prorocentrum_lima.AAC.1
MEAAPASPGQPDEASRPTGAAHPQGMQCDDATQPAVRVSITGHGRRQMVQLPVMATDSAVLRRISTEASLPAE